MICKPGVQVCFLVPKMMARAISAGVDVTQWHLRVLLWFGPVFSTFIELPQPVNLFVRPVLNHRNP